MKTGPRPTPAIDRALDRLVKNTTTGCLEWPGATSSGYGVIGSGPRLIRVHRLVYEFFNGPIPEGLHIDHLCRNRKCAEPTHLEVVTQAENNRRRWQRSPVTHCKRGHELTEGAFYRYRDGGRRCKACVPIRRKQRGVDTRGIS